MKILYHIPYPNSTGAERWIYEGWRDAFIDLGHEFYELTANDILERKLTERRPDIFWTAYNIFNIVKQKEVLKQIRGLGTKVFMRMDWPRKNEEIEVMKNEDIVDVYFDEREPESMKEFEQKTGRKFYTVANASNKLLHFPAEPVKQYQYDIVYLGARLPLKKFFFDKILIPLTKRYKVGIFGPNWTFRDNFLRACGKFFKSLRFNEGVTFINKYRVVIPPEEENKLYSSAKISLNFHERETDGSQPHYILNQRTFKIPACGGFQICDHVPAIRKYFADDEVITANPNAPEDWFKKIDYYLNYEEARKKIQEKGTEKALKEHTYHNRVQQILDIYHKSLTV